MGKMLIIAEKPSVATDLARVLGRVPKNGDFYEDDRYVISSAVGHLIELSMPEEISPEYAKWTMDNLPILPKKFKIKPVEKTKKKFTELKRLMGRADVSEVINACDAGREGELIFTYIYEHARCKKPIRRLWMSSMTPDAIRKAFDHLREGEEMRPLQDAARSRSEADWLIGLNATRGATITFGRRGGKAATVGRVQTPTLAMVCQREREIREFTSRPYWEITSTFLIEAGTYEGLYQRPDFKKSEDEHDRVSRLWSEKEALEICDAVRGGTAQVSDHRKRTRQSAPRLYDLTSLQREASSRYGFSAGATLSITQALYEKHKAVTYPRTDSRALPEDYPSTCSDVLRSLTGKYLPFANKIRENAWINPSDRRVFNNKQVSDHFAIIPTSQAPSKLSEPEGKIYDMITSRFLAVFYPAAEFDITTRTSVVGEHSFKTEGKVLAFPGWLEVYGKSAESNALDQSGRPSIPALSPSDGDPAQAAVEDVRIDAKETQPPPRFTEATLLSAMENAGKRVDDEELAEAMKERGLGTPATRASIIDHLIRESYMERDGREIRPTSKGMSLIDFLNYFHIENLTKPELTGEWEYKLRQVEEGKLSRQDFMDGISQVTTKVIESLRNPPKPRSTTLNNPLGPQPLIEDYRAYISPETVEIRGRAIPLLAVNKVVGNRPLEREEVIELLKKREIGPLEGFRSKTGKPFAAILKLVEKENGTHRVELDFGESANGENGDEVDLSQYEVVGQCPLDGAPIHATPNAFVCANYFSESDKCSFRISRTILNRSLTTEEFKSLLNDKRTPLLKGFRSKRTGKLFDSMLVLKDDGGIGFEFPERPKKAAAKKSAGRPTNTTKKSSQTTPAKKAAKKSSRRESQISVDIGDELN